MSQVTTLAADTLPPFPTLPSRAETQRFRDAMYEYRYPQLIKVRNTGRAVLYASPDPMRTRTCWLPCEAATWSCSAGWTRCNGGGPVGRYIVKNWAREKLIAAGVIPTFDELVGSEVRP